MTDIRISPAPLRADMLFGGHSRIIGSVDELGVAGRYKVFLHDRRSGACIASTWSDTDGTYAFNDLAQIPLGYYVIAFDHGDNPVNAAIADLITPEPMA